MKKEDIQTKIDVIFNNLDKLKFFKAKSYEEFISDFRNIDSSLHILQTSIQALLDIGSYIIASLGLKTPKYSLPLKTHFYPFTAISRSKTNCLT